MKKSLITLAVLAFAGTAMAQGVVFAGAVGGNTVNSASAATASASGTGAATSGAWNNSYSKSGVAVSGNVAADNTNVYNVGSPKAGAKWTNVNTATNSGNVGVEGVAVTKNQSGVRTTQSGSALAAGAAGGLSTAVAGGAGQFSTIPNGPNGSVAGAAGSTTATGVASVGNGAAVRDGGMDSYFGATAAADSTKVTTTKGVLYVIQVGQPSQVAANNANTTAYGGAVSNGGYAGPTSSTVGNAVGGILNLGTGNALSNASATNQVLAVTLGL